MINIKKNDQKVNGKDLINKICKKIIHKNFAYQNMTSHKPDDVFPKTPES